MVKNCWSLVTEQGLSVPSAVQQNMRHSLPQAAQCWLLCLCYCTKCMGGRGNKELQRLLLWQDSYTCQILPCPFIRMETYLTVKYHLATSLWSLLGENLTNNQNSSACCVGLLFLEARFVLWAFEWLYNWCLPGLVLFCFSPSVSHALITWTPLSSWTSLLKTWRESWPLCLNFKAQVLLKLF